MKTFNFVVSACILFLLSAINTFAQDTNVSYYSHELTFGIGYAYGFEKSVFNLEEDNSVESTVGLNINYCYYLNKNIGIGARMFGYTKELPEYYLYYPNGSSAKQSFTLNTYNFDGEFRYVFQRGMIEPYGFLLLGLASGIVSSSDENLTYSGFNAGFGAGAKLRIGERWRLSAEFIGSFGNAAWESKPFVNSASDEFNPSTVGLLLNVSYVFGPEKIIKGSK
jgi:hypothetical protein